MEIRKATAKDFKELYKFAKSIEELEVVPGQPFMMPDEFNFAITNRKGIFLVAKEAGEVAGFSYAYMDEPHYAWMVYVAVSSKFRGRGIGSELNKRREVWLRAHGARAVYTLTTNKSAIDIHRHWGYRKGKKLVWMYKEL